MRFLEPWSPQRLVRTFSSYSALPTRRPLKIKRTPLTLAAQTRRQYATTGTPRIQKLKRGGKEVTVLNTKTRSYNTAGYAELQSARPVPSPVHRYNASTSRRRSCCSPKPSSRRPLTWARAERMTLRKFLYGFFLVSIMSLISGEIG
jgi:hypothetical protein